MSRSFLEVVLSKKQFTYFDFKGPVVKGYDAFNHISTAGLDLKWRRKTAESIADWLPASARVLDVACGSGDMAIAVKKLTPQTQVIGSDPSREMLKLLPPKLNGSLHVSPLQAVNDLPFPTASFDAISIAFGVRNFARLDYDMRECLRLLKPGGRLFVLEFFRPHSRGVEKFLTLYQRTLFPVLGFLLTGHVSQYRYLYRSIMRFRTRESFAELLEQAGFENIQMRPFFFGMTHLVTADKTNG